MREYSRLSDYDFELLIRDLLGAELGVPLESFARGRDKGIDLRYLASRAKPSGALIKTTGGLIVQCKHYIKSGYPKLKAKIKQESVKFASLAPDRLILTTSTDLTPDNKAELRNLLSPYVLSDSDVIGLSDIEGLLNRHPQVERINYKLWLTSSTVLDQVLHSHIYNQTNLCCATLKGTLSAMSRTPRIQWLVTS